MEARALKFDDFFFGDGQNTDCPVYEFPKWTTPKNNILNEYYLKL